MNDHWLQASLHRLVLALKGNFMAKAANMLLFMHIPKTAGSSLNAYLESYFLPKEVSLHIENFVLVKPRNEITELEGKRLLTAHLKYDTLADLVDVKAYFTMTMLRDPVQQTLSHLAWVNRLGYPEQKKEFENHPDYIKRIVERIHSTDILTFLTTMDRHESNLFDNCQTRYFLPFHGEVSLNQQHLTKAIQNLSTFDLVALQEKFTNSLMLLAFYMGWKPPKQTPWQNASNKKYFIDLEGADQSIKESIDNITRFDRDLYCVAQRLFEKQRINVLHALNAISPLFTSPGEDKEQFWDALEYWLNRNNSVNRLILLQRFLMVVKDKVKQRLFL